MASLGTIDLKNLPRTDREQITNLLTPKMTEYIVHRPYPKQAAFMLLDGKEAFYGGAAGGGKSDALLMCALQYVDQPKYSAIIFRKTFADLVKPGALIDRAKEWLAPWTVTKQVRWVEKERKFVFPSGAILQFGYLETDNDRFNYQGGEYQFIGFDEVTHISEVNYKYLFSRLRRLKGAMVPLRIRAASNPPDDGDDAEWVYDRFVNPETKRPHVVFISAGLDDNPHLDKEEYVEALEELDPVTRARLRDGVWTIKRAGNMFKRDWFEMVDAPPPYRRTVRFWDCAGSDPKKNKKADWTVGLKLSEYRGIYYIESITRLQGRPQAVEEAQKNTAISDGKRVITREEQEPGSSGIATIDFKARGIFKTYNYKGVKSTGSKVDRALAVSAAAERGCIKVVRGCQHLEAFFDEAECFPKGAHDDTIDALSGAFNELGVVIEALGPTSVTERAHNSWDIDTETLDSPYASVGSYWGGI